MMKGLDNIHNLLVEHKLTWIKANKQQKHSLCPKVQKSRGDKR